MKKIIVSLFLLASLSGIAWAPYVEKLKGVKRTNLIRLFYINESSGFIVKDASDYDRLGNQTNQINGVTLAASNQPNGMNAAFFDGINDWINLSSNNSFSDDWQGRADGTVLFWVAPTDWTQDASKIFHFRIDATHQIRVQQPTGNSNLQYLVESGTSANQTVTFTSGNNVWLNSVFAFRDNLFSIWTNGTFVISNTSAAINSLGAGTCSASIGSSYNAVQDFYPGYIGVFAFWDTFLTEDEIRFISKLQ